MILFFFVVPVRSHVSDNVFEGNDGVLNKWKGIVYNVPADKTFIIFVKADVEVPNHRVNRFNTIQFKNNQPALKRFYDDHFIGIEDDNWPEKVNCLIKRTPLKICISILFLALFVALAIWIGTDSSTTVGLKILFICLAAIGLSLIGFLVTFISQKNGCCLS